jgi:RNA polymerase sigma factor (sigma-70 family)
MKYHVMATDESVSEWIDRLKHGDAAAAQKLWERYWGKLLQLARKKLQTVPRQVADEEDLALSAFNSLCSAARSGFSKLTDREDLWQLLFVLTERKATNRLKHEKRQKRDRGRVADGVILDELCSPEPTPAFAAEVAEQCQRLLDCLDDELRFVALQKLEGRTNEEIAAQLGCVTRSVERRLRLIRKTWKQDNDAAHE